MPTAVVGSDCWTLRPGARTAMHDLLVTLVGNSVQCATMVAESILQETAKRVTRMTQIHIHRRNDYELHRHENEGNGSPTTATAAAGGGGGTGSTGGTVRAKATRGGLLEQNLAFLRGLSAKVISTLTRHHEDCERQAYQFYSTAQDLAASPPEPFPPVGSTPTEGAPAAAEGSQEAAGGSSGGDAADGGGGDVEDGDDEARREAAECAREDWEEEVRQYREAGNQAQETAESVSAMITNILYYMATGSAR
ncbi:expressed unknown protein [Ectocarpus siliculosus]|uniref:Uncharacterized protein n=1 Tax=Ectocarpus siliculosus TaxID=2880 RepID=D7FK76_ECTSI|nr:expressed unknown protein [Ectocarpus siliculosus]|eukprot:CBJ29281.1 expressed unknown protein [Ectocarpus siliculosus]